MLGTSTKNFVSGSTYELQTDGASFSGSTYGNLVINFAGSAGINTGGVLTNVLNDLTIQNTGTSAFRLASTQSPTLTINGKLLMQGGAFEASTSTGVPVINVGGNFEQSGGNFKLSTTSTGGQSLNVTGNIILSGGVLQPMGSTGVANISVRGDWTNNGGVFTPGLSTVTFNNISANQTINGTAGSQTFHGLTLNKNATRLIIDGGTATVIVDGALTFPTATSGIITSTALHVLSITNTATTAISGGGTSAYIDGPVIWTLPSNLATGSTYNFPVGNTSYLPFGLKNPITGAGTVTAEVQAFNTDPAGTFDGTLTSISNSEYWSLNTAGSFDNSTVLLGKPGISSNAIAATADSPGGQYTSLGGTVSGIFIINSNDIGSNRFFTLATRPSSMTIDVPLSPASVTTTYGTASSNMTFTVSGIGIDGGIVITPPAGFEVSSDPGGTTGFGATATISGSGTIVPTVIYARLKATTNFGTYSGDITVSSPGADDKTVTILPSNVDKAALILTITAHDQHKTYGNTLAGGPGSTSFTATGLQNGNIINSVTIAYGPGSAATDVVNTYIGSVTASTPVGATFDPNNYDITYVPGNIIVDPKVLTITGVTAGNKQYDGMQRQYYIQNPQPCQEWKHLMN